MVHDEVHGGESAEVDDDGGGSVEGKAVVEVFLEEPPQE